MTFIIIAIVYTVIAFGFFTAMIVESRKQEATMGILNFAVAILWPFWLSWYSFLQVQDWWYSRGNRV